MVKAAVGDHITFTRFNLDLAGTVQKLYDNSVLVELTEDIRRERRERIREIQWEREELERLPKMLPPPPPPLPAPPRSKYDERIYEREYYYDREGRRYR